MRVCAKLRKIPHLVLPRAGSGASHAHAHSNHLPKLRPRRRHVSDTATYLGLLAVRARGLYQARQPGEISDRDAGGDGGQAGCVGSIRSEGSPNQGTSVTRLQIKALLSSQEVESELIKDILAKFSEMGVDVVETRDGLRWPPRLPSGFGRSVV
jgi:hypothetical protein